MLGRLHMSVDGAIEAYAKLAGRIFSETKWWWKEGRYKACRLVKATNVTVGENTPHDTQADETLPLTKEEKDQRNAKIGNSIRMLDPREDEERCPVFVCAVAADNGAFQPRLRTYPVVANATPNCAIWEAARATSAAPYFFKPTIIYENNTSMRIIDGGLGCNNPTLQLLDEVAGRFPTRRIACILSLGTGQRSVIQLRAAGGIPKLQLFGMYKMLQKISTDCEETHAQISDRFQNRPNVYFRFNVEQGMQGVGLQEWKKLGQVQSHTLAYTQNHTASRAIDNVVVALIDRRGFVTVEQAAVESSHVYAFSCLFQYNVNRSQMMDYRRNNANFRPDVGNDSAEISIVLGIRNDLAGACRNYRP
ncbi:hypothetical protein FRC12_005809 [Ceratobasidium sp. 428]|nr:hypothetical protein FRC12_005809 [Ceratobasidium sp. 428]